MQRDKNPLPQLRFLVREVGDGALANVESVAHFTGLQACCFATPRSRMGLYANGIKLRKKCIVNVPFAIPNEQQTGRLLYAF